MGIPGLWEILGDGEVEPIAKLATEFNENYGRPFRIAVDEAGWRFNNLNDHQVALIQAKEPRSHPLEKAILYKVLKLMRLNIELLIVFDGQRRPSKRGKRGGTRPDFNRTRLVRELLDHLRVPIHDAPGEAEAECAWLQQQGIVDAVWSDDSDTLMFGCTLMLRTFYEQGKKNGTKSQTHVRVYRAETISAKHRLDKYGMALIAMMSGGDYDETGIHRCGPRLALKAAQQGLGKRLSTINDWELPMWRKEIEDFCGTRARVPQDWPDPKILRFYRDPKVSTPSEYDKPKRLMESWMSDKRAFNELRLRKFLLEIFNFQNKGYVTHILPIVLLKILRLTQPGNERVNDIYGVEICAARSKKNVDDPSYVTKIKFKPRNTTSLPWGGPPLQAEPRHGDHAVGRPDKWWEEPLTGPDLLECEMLECMLRRMVPQAFEAAEAKKQIGKGKAKAQSTTGKAQAQAQSTEVSESSEMETIVQKERKRKPPSDDFEDAKTPAKRPATLKSRKNDTPLPSILTSPAASKALKDYQNDTRPRRAPMFRVPPTLLDPSLMTPPLAQAGVQDENRAPSSMELDKANLAARIVALAQLPIVAPSSIASTSLQAGQSSRLVSNARVMEKPALGSKTDPIDLGE